MITLKGFFMNETTIVYNSQQSAYLAKCWISLNIIIFKSKYWKREFFEFVFQDIICKWTPSQDVENSVI